MDEVVEIPGVPLRMSWIERPVEHRTGDRTLAMRAAGGTSWFSDPAGTRTVFSAPALLGRAGGDCQLSAKVEVDFASTFDAAALVILGDDHHWAKLCFELSPDAEPMVVSVVTREVSDDCNSFVIDDDAVWLRLARMGDALAFHASTDAARWRLVRYFSLGATRELALGLLAQSPTGSGCGVTFSEIVYVPERLTDLRGGT